MPTSFYQRVIPRSNCVGSHHVKRLKTGRLPKHSVRSTVSSSITSPDSAASFNQSGGTSSTRYYCQTIASSLPAHRHYP
ncbi:hypothetical protein TNCV_2873931 [Trichonephila clavipes]|nr:hypothetical protein TNCV_2873931 [Trichonephila clavipes]